jgi:hypothetical protein
MAAVLACGAGAVLSHRSAAALWGIVPASGVAPELTAPGRIGRRPGILGHESQLQEDERDVLDGIPVTSLCRTLLDLASVLSRRQLERAMNEAEVRGLTDPVGLPELLRRHPRRIGNPAVRALLDGQGFGPTQSPLEERFADMLESADLPPAERNASVAVAAGFLTVDCLWRRQRLVVELDGRASHGTPLAFEEDRRRDRLLHAAGWRVVRVTWRQLRDEAGAVLADLRAALAAAPTAPTL